VLVTLAAAGGHRVNRGGSWNNNGNNLRAANRNRNTPENRNNNLGFRCASTPPAGRLDGRRRQGVAATAAVRVRRGVQAARGRFRSRRRRVVEPRLADGSGGP
jgi:hypothetical protein